MRPLGRRSLFALPLVAPMAVAATVKGPTPPLIDGGPMETLSELAASLQEWKPATTFDEAYWDKITAEIGNEIAAEIARLEPSARDLAATLRIPHDEPRAWTNEEIALTLGLDVQRDGIVVSAMAVRT